MLVLQKIGFIEDSKIMFFMLNYT